MAPIRVIGGKQKLLELLGREEGNADRGKALAAGAVLGGSVLAQMLLTPAAHAGSCLADASPCNSFNMLNCLDSSHGPGHDCTPACRADDVVTCKHE